MNAVQLSKKLGYSRFLVDNIRKAAKLEGKPISKYADVADIKAWLKEHPTFVASRTARNLAPVSLPSSQPCQDAGKSGEQSLTSGPQTASPLPDSPPHAQAS